MGPAAIPIAVAATAVSGVSAIKQSQEAKKQGRAQREQAAQTEASNVSEAARQRRSALRRARANQAAISAAGIASGTTGSSADIAVSDAQAGQVADSASKASGELLAIGNMSAQNQVIAASQRRQQTFAAIGNFSSRIGGFALQTPSAQSWIQENF